MKVCQGGFILAWNLLCKGFEFTSPSACTLNQTFDITQLDCVSCPENTIPDKTGFAGACICPEGWKMVQNTGSVDKTVENKHKLTCEQCPVGTRPSRPDGRRCIRCPGTSKNWVPGKCKPCPPNKIEGKVTTITQMTVDTIEC